MRRRLVLAAVAGAALLLAGCSTPSNPSTTPSSTSSAGASPTGRTVHLNGISMTLPAGWFQTEPQLCGNPQPQSVTVFPSPAPVAACPASTASKQPGPSVQLLALFGPWGTTGWSGKQTTWNGQPAWLTEQTRNGSTPTASGAGPLTTTLALPWLNAAITIQDADAATTKGLLSHMTVVTQPDLGVPESARSMSLVSAFMNQKPATTTSQNDIAPVLDALRNTSTVPTSQACDIPNYFGPRSGGMVVTFTTSSGSTSFLMSLAPCNQTTSGTGVAGLVDSALSYALAAAPQPSLR